MDVNFDFGPTTKTYSAQEKQKVGLLEKDV